MWPDLRAIDPDDWGMLSNHFPHRDYRGSTAGHRQDENTKPEAIRDPTDPGCW